MNDSSLCFDIYDYIWACVDFIFIVPYLIPTDCSALRAPAILKTFEIRPFRAAFSCFAGPKVIFFHASMKKYDLLTLVSYHELPDKWASRRFFRALHSQNRLKHSKSAHFSAKNGYFLMFSGTHRHKNTCKHVFYVHLSLGSYHTKKQHKMQ